MKFVIYNTTDSLSVLILEPVASSYEIQAHSKVTVEGNFVGAPDGYGEIEILSDNSIALYTNLDTTVSQDGKVLRPNPKY